MKKTRKLFQQQKEYKEAKYVFIQSRQEIPNSRLK